MKYRDRDTKTFQENTKDMSFGQKLDYIWDYYKVWILTTAFVLFMVISMGIAKVRNIRAMELVQLAVLTEAIEEAEDRWQEEATLISTPYFGVDVPVNLMLGARLAANELDVSLLPDDHTMWINNQEGARDLREILILPEDAQTLVDEETGIVYAICINDTPFYRAADEKSDYIADLYLSVSAQEERLPNAIAFAQMIVDTIGTN